MTRLPHTTRQLLLLCATLCHPPFVAPAVRTILKSTPLTTPPPPSYHTAEMPDSAPAQQAEDPRPPALPPANPGPEISTSDSAPDTQTQPFGAQLQPVLLQVCQGRLCAVTWFRTDWQRGGALTGYAQFKAPDGSEHPVVVKLPIGPAEYQWLVRLQDADGLVPRLYAHGQELGGYDFAWVVMERLPHGPLSPAWSGQELDLLLDALARFHHAASRFPIDRSPDPEDWPSVLERARLAVERTACEHPKRWKTALQAAQRNLNHWLRDWDRRPIDQWCHGDVHLANALTRVPAPQGPAVLIDFALTRPGNWVEDAVYLEHQYWGRRQRLAGRKICQLIARQRKQFGLLVDPDWSRWASLRRALLAMGAPAVPRHLADPPHLGAALEMLEKELSSR